MNPKLLIFIDWYKPGYKAGGPIRSISNLVDHLCNKLDIYIITRDTDYLETTPYSNIKSNQWNSIDGASVYYLSKENQNLKTIKKLTKEVNPQQLYCNCLYSPIFTQIPLFLSKRFKIQSIIAVRGMLSPGSLGVKSQKKQLFLFLSKTLGLYKRCTFHASTNDEKKDIQSAFGKNTKIIVAQNLPERKPLQFQHKTKEANQLNLVSIGRVAPEKNTLYALEILKEVKSNITFDIYGPIYNQEYWNKCEAIINQMPDNIVVNYKGVLPHSELDTTLKKYHTFLSPSTGENFGHSIIEAMINSCIPIISDKTPWRNLEVKNIGFDISLRDKSEFINAIEQLADYQEEEFNNWSKKSHFFAQNIINNKEIIEDYYKLFHLQN